MNSKKLLVVGELNVDLILNNIQGFPKLGTEIVAEQMSFTLGSSSAIMASNISALGVDTTFCGMVGTDDFGDFVLRQLKLKNVDTRFVQKSPDERTGITVVMNYEQDRANVTYCGAMDLFTINDIPWDQLEGFRHFHLSNYFLQKGIKDSISDIFKKAKAAGLTTSLDLQVDPDDQWDFDFRSCLPYVDVFLPNEKELLALTRTDNIEDGLNKLKPYTNIIALKMGDKGGMVISAEGKLQRKPFLNKVFEDAIGAGDSFNAGFLQKFMESASLEDCLLNANLIGSLSTTKPGGTGAFSSPETIEALKQQILDHQL